MKIYQTCILNLIESAGFICDFHDTHSESIATYHFGKDGTVTFSSSCVSFALAKIILSRFGLENLADQLNKQECICNW